MRILHVIPSLARRNGGAAKAAVEMCRELARRGHKVKLYTTDADGTYVSDAERHDHMTIRPEEQMNRSGMEIRYFPKGLSKYYKVSPCLTAALRRDIPACDLVHIHCLYQYPSSIAAYYSRRFAVPYIIIPHGSLDPFIFRRHRPRKWIYETLFERRNLREAAAIQFTTEEEMYLASSHNFHFHGAVAPLGVDLEPPAHHEDMQPVGCRQRADGKKTVLFLGRLNFKKGLDILIRALGEICRQRTDVRLVIAGPDDDGYAFEVRRFVRCEGVESNVTFAGMLLGSAKAEAFATADLFVLPSYSENFGIAVVEAMGAGLPVVISNKVNIWRDVARAGAGLVVNTNQADLAAAIMRLLDNPVLARDMATRGKCLARDSFSWEAAGRLLVALYDRALSANRRPSNIGRAATRRTSI